MDALTRVWVRVAAALVLVWPRLAEACPACAGRQRGGIASSILVTSMVLFPVAAAIFGYRFIKRLNAHDAGSAPAPEKPTAGQ